MIITAKNKERLLIKKDFPPVYTWWWYRADYYYIPFLL
jgi:hypothetical protein